MISGIATYALLGPMLTVLFDNSAITSSAARPEFAFSLDYVRDLFSYYLSGIVSRGGIIRGLAFVSLMLIAACFVANLCRYLSQRILVSMKTTLMRNIRKDLFTKINTLGISYFTERRKGDILSCVSNDVSEVQNSVASSFHVFFREPLLALGFLAMLFYMSPRLTLVSLIALPISAFIVTRITRYLRAGSIETQSLMGSILARFEEAVSGSRIVKAFNAGKYLGRRFDAENERHRQVSAKVGYRQELASPVSEFLGISIAAVVLFYGGWLNMHGKLGMSWEQFIVYIMFYWKVLEPAKAISNSYAAVRKGLVSADRIFAILDTEPSVCDAPGAVRKESFDDEIRFKGVSFSYESKPVLDNVDLVIPKGKMVAVVGHSGAGKSTMADLLARFRDVGGGSITIDGTDIRSIRLEDLRSLMGIVPQDPVLFNDTVFNNIAFAVEGASAEAVREAAAMANADGFISQLEKGYDTVIGEGGSKLSGGQRQRLAIARALLKNPPVLILDEATSSLDTESERLVQNALQRLMGGRTSLVIAHRLSTIRHADEIVVLHDGKVAERGRHEDLVAKGGIYAHLCSLQDFS